MVQPEIEVGVEDEVDRRLAGLVDAPQHIHQAGRMIATDEDRPKTETGEVAGEGEGLMDGILRIVTHYQSHIVATIAAGLGPGSHSGAAPADERSSAHIRRPELPVQLQVDAEKCQFSCAADTRQLGKIHDPGAAKTEPIHPGSAGGETLEDSDRLFRQRRQGWGFVLDTDLRGGNRHWRI